MPVAHVGASRTYKHGSICEEERTVRGRSEGAEHNEQHFSPEGGATRGKGARAQLAGRRFHILKGCILKTNRTPWLADGFGQAGKVCSG